MADTLVSNTSAGNGVRVRLPLGAPNKGNTVMNKIEIMDALNEQLTAQTEMSAILLELLPSLPKNVAKRYVIASRKWNEANKRISAIMRRELN
jgi:hypothetical protein